MSESNGEWKFQLSLKLGADKSALLNVRAVEFGEFLAALDDLVQNEAEVRTAAELFEKRQAGTLPKADVRATPPPAPRSAPAPPREPGDDADAFNDSVAGAGSDEATRPAYTPPKPSAALAGQEIGPIVCTKAQEVSGTSKTTGKAYTSYPIEFGGGAVKASTFDWLFYDIAKKNLGKSVMVRIEKNAKGFNNIVEIRPVA